MKLIRTPQPLSQAMTRAMAREVVPSVMGSAEMRQAFTAEMRERAVISARTTNAWYLQSIKEAAERALKAGYNNDRGQLRLLLRGVLQRFGYTPHFGFPGDAKLGIPPAEPGSLQDLSSDARLNLILDTQEALMHGAGLKARGLDRMDAFPAWELVRIYKRRTPRGAPGSGTRGWEERWAKAGGKIVTDVNRKPRLMAYKDDPVWAGLGDSGLFDDALDVDHPPFAFRSGMGWREVPRAEAEALLGKRDKGQGIRDKGKSAEKRVRSEPGSGDPSQVVPSKPSGAGAADTPPRTPLTPVPRMSTGGMDPAFKAALIKKLQASGGNLTDADVGRLGREVVRELGNTADGSLERGRVIKVTLQELFDEMLRRRTAVKKARRNVARARLLLQALKGAQAA